MHTQIYALTHIHTVDGEIRCNTHFTQARITPCAFVCVSVCVQRTNYMKVDKIVDKCYLLTVRIQSNINIPGGSSSSNDNIGSTESLRQRPKSAVFMSSEMIDSRNYRASFNIFEIIRTKIDIRFYGKRFLVECAENFCGIINHAYALFTIRSHWEFFSVHVGGWSRNQPPR